MIGRDGSRVRPVYLVMHAKGPLDAPVTPRNIVGGATWGLRNGFDVAPRGARAPHARPRAWPFPVTARFGHPLLENRFPSHLFRVLSLGVKPAGDPEMGHTGILTGHA